jgi:molybdate transport system substrate-binding protein
MKALSGSVALRALLIAGAALLASPVSASDIKVFAAASLTDALGRVLDVCEAETGIAATGIYAGSGTIARQIDQGAPASLYISANPQWMDWLEKRGRIIAETRADLLGNALVLIGSPEGESNASPLGTAFFSTRRIAMGEPSSVPVGHYTRQARRSRGWWDGLYNIVQTSSVREVLTWVVRGEVAVGAVYRTDAKAEPRAKILLEFEADEHDPIRYPTAIIADYDSPKVRRLLTCIKGEKASGIFEKFGFTTLQPR